MSDSLNDLEGKLKLKNIAINVKNDCIVVRGNQQGVKEAESEIDLLVKAIYDKPLTLKMPGLDDFIGTSNGKQKIKQVSKQADVLISSESDEDLQSGGHGICRSAAGPGGGTVYNTQWGQEIIVVKGDITGLDVDVIVNAANNNLQHGGGLARVIVTKGGQIIQTECDQHINSNGKLSEGEVFCSGPGNLNCKAIVHVVGPSWQGGGNREEEYLSTCVESALEETEGRQLSSIAFPALCTGIFSYPAREATRVIAETVREYFKDNYITTCIQKVYLCDVKDESVDCFQKAASKFFGKGSGAFGGDRRSHGDHKGNRFSGGNASAAGVTMGKIQVKIIKGELAKMKVDMVVNTTARDLNLQQGAVSASLSKNAGPSLQQECQQKYPNGIKYGEVAVTSGGKLPCKFVCHGSLDQWRSDGSSIKILEDFINGCLSTADSKGCTSVALPAMGTGKLGYQRDLVSKHMYSCVEQFAHKNPRTKINEVLFVLYNKDFPTVQAFEDEEKQRRGGTDKRHSLGTPTSHKGRDLYDDSSDEDTELWENIDQDDQFEQQGVQFGLEDTQDEPDIDILPYPRDRYHLSQFRDRFQRQKEIDFSDDRQSARQVMLEEKHRATLERRREIMAQREQDRLDRKKALVLGRVIPEERAKMEEFFSPGPKPALQRMISAPVLPRYHSKPLRKSRSENAVKLWDVINKPNYSLEDTEIELSMKLVKDTHPNIRGLQPVTVALAEGYKKPQGQFIQIINVKGQHWVTLSNIGCSRGQVKVYDSWKRNLDMDTKLAVMATVDCDGSSKIHVEICQFQKQHNKYDCGLFAVAAMVTLANGQDPSQIIWDLNFLRSHFVNCLTKSKMVPFPLYEDQTKTKSNVLVQKLYTLTICMTCRQKLCDEDEQLCKNCRAKPW